MKRSFWLVFPFGLALWLLPSQAQADCCSFSTHSCAARDHLDPRCDAGTKQEGDLSDVFECWTAGFIAVSPFDPISYLIAVGLGEAYCDGQADDTCRAELPDTDCDDSDGDGLFNLWETRGLDPNNDGTIDVTLPGADPNRLDLYVEMDCLASDGNTDGDYTDANDHNHCPQQAAIQAVVNSFAAAPRTNLDGTSGIQLHVDTGSLYGAGVVLTSAGGGGVTGSFGDFGGGGNLIDEVGNTIIDWDGATGRAGTSFYTLKGANFNAARAAAYHYTIFGHQTNNRAAVNDCTSGWAEAIGCNDFMVTLGGVGSGGGVCWTGDANGFSVGSTNEQAGTFMHELGHCLGLGHGGGDGVNFKPNYLSVMNYSFQTCNVPASPLGAAVLPGGCDYSPVALATLNEPSLDECLGIDSNTLGFGSVNWDGDGVLEGVTNCQPPNATNSSAELNGDNGCIGPGANGTLQSALGGDDVTPPGSAVINDGANFTCNSTASGDDVQVQAVGAVEPALTGFDDWNGLVFAFQGLPSFANGVSSPNFVEADPAALVQARQKTSAVLHADVSVTVTAPATVLPGQSFNYGVRFVSHGRGPALEATWTNFGPAGAVTSTALGALLVGQTRDVVAPYTVPANACPMTLTDAAAIHYQDVVGEASTVWGTGSTIVLDIVPPVFSVAVTPNVLWPPNHRMVQIAPTFQVSDNCDPSPVVGLVGITSNEPDNGTGDGDTAGDILVDGAGRIFLRAERKGNGSGRVYTLTFRATDASGNQTTRTATVNVPHN